MSAQSLIENTGHNPTQPMKAIMTKLNKPTQLQKMGKYQSMTADSMEFGRQIEEYVVFRF